MHKPRRHHRGFTLIELLIAITVLAIVAVLGWRGLDGIVRARIALNHDLEQTRGMQLSFAQMQIDCARIAKSEDLQFLPTFDAAPGRLTIIRNVFAENEPTRVQVVSYRIDGDKLTRRETPATRDRNQLLAMWQAALNDTDNSPSVTLQTGVAAMDLRTWNERLHDWVPAVSADAGNAVTRATPGGPTPRGVEVALKLAGREKNMVKVFLLGAV